LRDVRNFLFSVKALSLVFRGKFLALLEQTFRKGELQFPGRTAALAEAVAFADLVHALRQKPWVVYTKRPCSSPEKVLDYLGRYTQRVALSKPGHHHSTHHDHQLQEAPPFITVFSWPSVSGLCRSLLATQICDLWQTHFLLPARSHLPRTCLPTASLPALTLAQAT